MIQYRLLLGILIIECLSVVSLHAQPNVYRDTVTPHWFADNTQFWYRNRLGRDEHEFVMVDAVNGTRNEAFDHQRVAAAFEAHSNAIALIVALEVREDVIIIGSEHSSSATVLQLVATWKNLGVAGVVECLSHCEAPGQ